MSHLFDGRRVLVGRELFLTGLATLGFAVLGFDQCFAHPVALHSAAVCAELNCVQDEVATTDDKKVDSDAQTEDQKQLIAKLEKYLTGAKLKGRFTMLGRNVPPQEEEYTIAKAEKLEEGDLWLIEARIKYGKWDQSVPLTMQIKWADKTPVITLEKLTIPTMGTFSARVLFNNGMYSGTWAHDEVKGHLFGEVIPAGTAEDSEKEATEKKDGQ